MKYLILFFIWSLLFVSCGETEKERMNRLVHEWEGQRRFAFPLKG